MIPPLSKKIKYNFAFFCDFMHFLKNFAKSAIYNITALFKTTNRMNKTVHKYVNIHRVCNIQKAEMLTYIKMFVQTAKGKYKNVTMFFSLSPNKQK